MVFVPFFTGTSRSILTTHIFVNISSFTNTTSTTTIIVISSNFAGKEDLWKEVHGWVGCLVTHKMCLGHLGHHHHHDQDHHHFQYHHHHHHHCHHNHCFYLQENCGHSRGVQPTEGWALNKNFVPFAAPKFEDCFGFLVWCLGAQSSSRGLPQRPFLFKPASSLTILPHDQSENVQNLYAVHIPRNWSCSIYILYL